MSNIKNRFDTILGSEVFKTLQSTDIIDLAQLNATIALLVKFNLPFELIFNQGTSTTVANAELTITLTPTISMTIILPFEKGPTET